jgi:hypothetical protein
VRYKRRYGEGIALNPMALAGNWTQLATEVQDHASNTTSGNQNRSGGGRGNGYSSAQKGYQGQHLPDADEWERIRQQYEREGRLAKPKGSPKGNQPAKPIGNLPAV